MKRMKLDKDAVAQFEKDHAAGEQDFFTDAHSGAVWICDGRYVMWFPSYEDTWKFWECLLHETNHVVFSLARDKNMQDETEAQAYLHEYLFKHIRRKLQKAEPLNA